MLLVSDHFERPVCVLLYHLQIAHDELYLGLSPHPDHIPLSVHEMSRFRKSNFFLNLTKSCNGENRIPTSTKIFKTKKIIETTKQKHRYFLFKNEKKVVKITNTNAVQIPTNFFNIDISSECYPATPIEFPIRHWVRKTNPQKSRESFTSLQIPDDC